MFELLMILYEDSINVSEIFTLTWKVLSDPKSPTFLSLQLHMQRRNTPKGLQRVGSTFCLFHLLFFCFKLHNPLRYMNPSVSTGLYAQSSSFKLCTGTADGSSIKCISWASTSGFLAKKISSVHQRYRASEGAQLRAGMKRYTSR